MNDVVLNNGTVLTDAKFVERCGGTLVPSFVATKEDLILLAHKLAKELLADKFAASTYGGRTDMDRNGYHQKLEYTNYRLDRVMAFLPELDAEIREELRQGMEADEKLRQGMEADELPQKMVEMEADESVDQFVNRLKAKAKSDTFDH